MTGKNYIFFERGKAEMVEAAQSIAIELTSEQKFEFVRELLLGLVEDVSMTDE